MHGVDCASLPLRRVPGAGAGADTGRQALAQARQAALTQALTESAFLMTEACVLGTRYNGGTMAGGLNDTTASLRGHTGASVPMDGWP